MDRIKAKYQIENNILYGSFESIGKLIQLFWKSTDKRSVVAVDAAAINSKITIHKDGQIDGLLHHISIDTDLVDLITSNSDEIIKYYFVFYVCSLSEENKSFPILVKRKTCGSANDEVIADFEQLVLLCQDAVLDVVGVSFDGNPSYLKYVDKICDEIGKLPYLD